MHELSIALGIVKIADDEFKKAKASRIESIELEIGTLSGVELDSLNYVWEAAVKDTVLENVRKDIIIVNAKAKCSDCETIFELNNSYDSCPNCKSLLKIILKGKELKVKSLEIE